MATDREVGHSDSSKHGSEPAAGSSREREELLNQSRILSREILTLQDAHHNIVSVLLRCQGLLFELSKDEVRRDFLAGRLCYADYSIDVLRSLDRFREIMMQSPRAAKGKVVNDDEAVAFVSKLLSKDPGEPVIGGLALPIRRSFSEWRTVFQTLLASRYWESADGSPGVDIGSAALPGLGSCMDDLRALKREPCGLNVDGLSSVGSRQRGHTRKKTSKKRRTKRKHYYSSDNSSFGSGGSRHSVDDATTDSEGDRAGRHHRCVSGDDSLSLVHALKNLKLQKEPVPPLVFNAKSGHSFKNFLSTFERFFDCKYTGDDRDRARKLEHYLGSDMKRWYEAIGGHNRRYKEVKRELLEMYETERVSRKEETFKQFQSMQMLSTDSMRMYAVRLEHVARKAFPDEAEAERQLCRKLKDTAPSAFIGLLAGAQNMLSMFGEKKMSWERMKKIAVIGSSRQGDC